MQKNDKAIENEEVLNAKDIGLGNLDLGNLAGLLKNVDISQVFNLLNSIDISQLSSLLGSTSVNSNGNNMAVKRSKEVELLSAIKPMVNSQRGELIDIILQIYSISRILK